MLSLHMVYVWDSLLYFCVHVYVAASITVLFKHVGSAEEPGSDESIREKVIHFIRDKVR